MKRNLSLDGLRGGAVICVVFWHMFFVYPQRNPEAIQMSSSFNDFFNLGYFGVAIFFFLSGGLIFQSLANSKSRLDFIIKRCSRVCVPYWFALCVILIMLLTWGNHTFTTKQILANIFFVQDIFREKHVDGVFWTLVIEVKFYIIVFLLGRNFINKYIIEIITFFIVITIISALSHLFGIGLYYKLFSSLLILFTGLYYAIPEKKSYGNLAVVASLVCLYITPFIMPSTNYGSQLGYSNAVVVGWFLFVNAKHFSFLLESKFLIFFGLISYSLYLYHQELSYLLIGYLIPIYGILYSYIATAFLIILLSIVSYNLIENFVSNKVKDKLLN